MLPGDFAESVPFSSGGYGFGVDATPAPGDAPLPNTVPPGAPTADQGPGPVVPLAPLPPSAAPAPSSARARAGMTILVTGAGVGAGALLGGAWGAGSGLFLAGAASNAWQSRVLWQSPDPSARGEAMKRTVMTIVGLGLGAYFGYRAHQAKKNED